MPTETGRTKPDASTTGVPELGTYDGPLTITEDGTVIEGVHVYGDLRIQARDVVVRNCYLHGGKTHPRSNTGCVDANSARVFNLLVEDCTIIPDFPSWYRDGIVGHEYTARRNHITRSNDGLGIFSKPGGNGLANVVAEGNYIHDLTRWARDPARATGGTHNDGIQIQGGANIHIVGNTVVGSVVAAPGETLGAHGTHGGAALLVQQNVVPVSNCVIEDNWFDDAQNSVCVQHGKYPEITVTLRRNLFGRNQLDFGRGSKYPIRIYSRSRDHVIDLFTNRWEDTGEFLVEGRDGGIRYNAD